MRIHVNENIPEPFESVRVGNVYACRGGRAAMHGRMMVVLAITEPEITRFGPEGGGTVLMMVLRQDGQPPRS